MNTLLRKKLHTYCMFHYMTGNLASNPSLHKFSFCLFVFKIIYSTGTQKSLNKSRKGKTENTTETGCGDLDL